MDVLDSNLWVFAFTGTNRHAVELVDEAVDGEREIAVDAYIHGEVVAALTRSSGLTASETDEAVQDFLDLLTGTPSIHTDFTQVDVRGLDLDARRMRPQNRLLATVLDVQPKDAPLVTLAFRYYDREPTIHTNDESFSRLVPVEHNLTDIEVTHVTSDDPAMSASSS